MERTRETTLKVYKKYLELVADWLLLSLPPRDMSMFSARESAFNGRVNDTMSCNASFQKRCVRHS